MVLFHIGLSLATPSYFDIRITLGAMFSWFETQTRM
jgi:hypothetical protein